MLTCSYVSPTITKVSSCLALKNASEVSELAPWQKPRSWGAENKKPVAIMVTSFRAEKSSATSTSRFVLRIGDYQIDLKEKSRQIEPR
jgi:hypothetical protein